MSRRFTHLKPLLGLLAFLVLWWLIPPTLKLLGRASFYEFQAPMVVASSHLRDLQTYWGLRGQSKDELIAAGRDLARINAQGALSRQQTDSLRDEVARLESLLELPEAEDYHYEIARVAQRDLTAWWQRMTIRKGKNHGIPIGAAVVYAGGVVGRVREVHAYTSVVELVSSPGFRMAASLEGEVRPVTYQGMPNPPLVSPVGEASNIPPDVRVSPAQPKRLVSSRLGGVFPQGLSIGLITELEPGADGYFQKGKVILDQDLGSLMEVAVAIPETEEDEDGI